MQDGWAWLLHTGVCCTKISFILCQGVSVSQGVACLRVHTELGAGVLVEAEVPDTSRLYVDVGLGFHVELQRAEALQVATERQAIAQVCCGSAGCAAGPLCRTEMHGCLQEQLRGAKQTLQKVQAAVCLAQQGLLDLRQSLQ